MVWSLCVILYEMVSGEHPFAGNGIDEVVNRIRRQRLARLALSPGAAESRSDVIAFAATMLTAARSVRPATAHAFGAALHGVLPVASRLHIADHGPTSSRR